MSGFSNQIKDILEKGGITATPVRILVYKALHDSPYPLSLSDIESILESVDKSTVSRTLSTFKKNRLVHSFNDGSGSVKYELCHGHSSGAHQHDDLHVHFRCEKCGATLCLTSVKVPQVALPEGFQPHEMNYIISGICDKCGLR